MWNTSEEIVFEGKESTTLMESRNGSVQDDSFLLCVCKKSDKNKVSKKIQILKLMEEFELNLREMGTYLQERIRFALDEENLECIKRKMKA